MILLSYLKERSFHWHLLVHSAFIRVKAFGVMFLEYKGVAQVLRLRFIIFSLRTLN